MNFSDIFPSADDYRWYLCLETNVGRFSWDCKEITKEEIASYNGNNRSTVVPIYKYYPRFLDKAFLNKTMKPRMRVVQEFKKTES